MLHDRNEGLLGAAVATGSVRRQAFLVMAVLVVAFAATVPLVRWNVAAVPQFVPIYDTAIFVLNMLAAVLLYAQFEHLQRPSLLVLACAYVFTPLVVAAHVLSIPNAYVQGTVMGGEQTAIWLWVTWHVVFPVFICAYALMAHTEPADAAVPNASRRPTGTIALMGTVAFALAAVVVVTVGDPVMPRLMRGDTQHSRVTTLVFAMTWFAHVLALGALVWYTRLRRVIDAWLAVTLVALSIDVLLSAVLIDSRYQLGFYLGRLYGLLAALFVLGALLRETVTLPVMVARSAAALWKSEEKYRTLFEAMEEGFALCEVVRDDAGRTVDYRVLEANAAFEQQHGVPGAEAMAGARLEACARVVASCEPMRLEQYNEGLGRWMSVGLFPRGGDQFAQLVYDITDRKRAHDALAQRNQALADLDHTKTTFFTNVSHEFRTPLTLMLGLMEEALVSSGSPLAGENLEMAYRNASRLLKLVNALLDFSRIQAGRLLPNYALTPIHTLTADIASAFRSTIERAGLAYDVRCEPMDDVYLDPDMWEKVVLNLISNAFKFTREGHINVVLRRVDGQIEFSVTDTGAGIPEPDLPRVFERFFRGDNAQARTHEGSGIGLSLVQELVKLHGGTVDALSTLGQGSCFTVRLPVGSSHIPSESIGGMRALASTASSRQAYVEEACRWLPPDPSSPRQDTGSKQPSDASEPEESRPRILLAEDNADMRNYIARLLGTRFEVEVVADGQAALEAARQRLPELVLADVMMPRLDGLGLLAALRSQAQTRELPVIVLSARAGEESRIEGLQCGADDYLVKPFTARELFARIETQVRMARQRRESRALLEQRVRERTRELEQAAELRRQLLFRMETLQNEERQRIARDLHDSFGQYLSSVSLTIGSFTGRFDDAAAKVWFTQIKDLLQQADEELDRIIFALRPTSLEDCGLGEGLSAYVRTWGQLTGVPVDLALHGLNGERLPSAIESAAFRVVQEALNNVSRHASASHVSVSAERLRRQLVVAIEDDGIGFEMGNNPASSRSERMNWGLLGMRERVESLGGVFAVESGPGAGTTVLLRMPLHPTGNRPEWRPH